MANEMTQAEKVKKIITTLEELPTLPVIITKLLGLLDNPMSTARDINNVIKEDQALTAKTLKMVNSAYYGFPKSISTLTDAVVVLGFNTVRSLSLSATVCKIFEGGGEDFDRAKLWEHSLGVAFASRIIAKMVRYPEEEEAFVAGLLHDIAKIVEDQNFHEEFTKAVVQSREKSSSLLEEEREYVGMDHSTIGRRIADRWGLPAKVTKVVGYHHQPQFAGSGEEKILTSIVHVADIIVRIRKIGDSGNYGIKLDKFATDTLKLKKVDLQTIAKKLNTELKAASEFLKIVKE